MGNFAIKYTPVKTSVCNGYILITGGMAEPDYQTTSLDVAMKMVTLRKAVLKRAMYLGLIKSRI